MARFSLRLSRIAEADLAAIYEHGARTWGVAQADRYFDALLQQFERLCENPLQYQAVDAIRPGYRRSVCGRHVIYYRVDSGAVHVMTVIKHQALGDRLD